MKRLLIGTLALFVIAAAAQGAVPTTQDLLRYVPSTAQVVMAVDGAALRAHPLVQKWLVDHQGAWGDIDDEGTRFLRDAGLDPARDVDAMVVAVTPKTAPSQTLALFGGRYDPASLGAALMKQGAIALQEGAVPLYRMESNHADPGAPRCAGTAAFIAIPSADLVIAGDEVSVRTAVKSSATGGNVARVEIAAGHIDPRATFWLVAVISPEMRAKRTEHVHGEHSETDQAVQRALLASGTVQRVSMYATLDQALTVHGIARTDTAENAELVRDAVKGALAAVRLEAQDSAPELVNILRDVNVTVNGVEVSGAGAVPVSVIEKLTSNHQGHAHVKHVQHGNAPVI